MATLLAAAGTAVAASGWGFDDATVSVKGKDGDNVSEKYELSHSPIRNSGFLG